VAVTLECDLSRQGPGICREDGEKDGAVTCDLVHLTQSELALFSSAVAVFAIAGSGSYLTLAAARPGSAPAAGPPSCGKPPCAFKHPAES
jgi:hypothetical protein